jgi:hypothetical protein
MGYCSGVRTGYSWGTTHGLLMGYYSRDTHGVRTGTHGILTGISQVAPPTCFRCVLVVGGRAARHTGACPAPPATRTHAPEDRCAGARHTHTTVFGAFSSGAGTCYVCLARESVAGCRDHFHTPARPPPHTVPRVQTDRLAAEVAAVPPQYSHSTPIVLTQYPACKAIDRLQRSLLDSFNDDLARLQSARLHAALCTDGLLPNATLADCWERGKWEQVGTTPRA